jgi:DNA-3-methyladenine glycosylase
VRKLSRSFYLRTTLTVARDLPGKLLLRRLGGRFLIGRIVEVEAYLGRRDPASHAYRGMTPRNEIMFGPGGHLYVYFTYGMHFCCNVVTERAGTGCAVLIRAVEPLEGMTTMERLRMRTGARALRSTDLCSGPGKLCQAFGIGRKENGADLCGTTLWIADDGGTGGRRDIGRSPRIGISSGREHRWRFFLKGNPYLSRPGKS